MKQKLLNRISGHGLKCLVVACCSLLVFGGAFIASNKQKETVSVYAEEGGVADFVSRLYTYVLEREADPNGLAGWTEALQNGDATGTEVAKGFIMSDEFLNKEMTNEEFVQILYRSFFGREAASNEVAAWVEYLNQGYRKSYIFAGFANSVEFGSLCEVYDVEEGSVHVTVSEQQPGLSDEEYNTWLFVERLYTEVLGRTPDVGGLGAWAGYLQDGTYTGAEVAEGFILSNEFENKDVSNEEYVQVMYNAFFGRKAGQAEVDAWVDVMENQYDKRYVFAGFANSTEFGNLCDDYEIEQGEVSALTVVPEAPYEIKNDETGIHLRWNAVENMTQYGVWRAEMNTAGEPGEYVWLGNIDKLEYYDANVVDGTTYYYKITAFDTEMQVHSDKSEAVSITYEKKEENVPTDSRYFTWTENTDGTVTITKYTGEDTVVIIPETIDGKTVTVIGAYCFDSQSAITSIEIPETVVTVEEQAFYYCSALTTLHLPAGVKDFYSGSIMYGCYAMASITVDAANPVYAAVDGILYDHDVTKMILVPNGYAGKITIPDTVITVSNSFANLHGITEIALGKNVKSFTNGVQNCPNLEKYTVAEGNPYFIAVDGILLSADKTVLYGVLNKGIEESYTIPDSVVRIATNAFVNCDTVKQITVPASVQYLGDEGKDYLANVFGNCFALENIFVDENNTVLKDVDGVLLSKDGKGLIAHPAGRAEETYTVPETVTVLGDHSFAWQDTKQVILPAGLQLIEAGAFFQHWGLESISIPSGVVAIYPSTFFGCTSLASVTFTEGTTKIIDDAFRNCWNLTTIYAPAGSYAAQWAANAGYSVKEPGGESVPDMSD